MASGEYVGQDGRDPIDDYDQVVAERGTLQTALSKSDRSDTPNPPEEKSELGSALASLATRAREAGFRPVAEPRGNGLAGPLSDADYPYPPYDLQASREYLAAMRERRTSAPERKTEVDKIMEKLGGLSLSKLVQVRQLIDSFDGDKDA